MISETARLPTFHPAATSVATATKAESFHPGNKTREARFYGPQWLPRGRNLTLLYAAADQDGWEGEIIVRDPLYADGRCLAVPRSALLLPSPAPARH